MDAPGVCREGSSVRNHPTCRGRWLQPHCGVGVLSVAAWAVLSAYIDSALQHHRPPSLTPPAGKVEGSSSGATALVCSQGSACRLSTGYLWNLQVKLQPIVNLLPDKGRLMDFLLQRKECKMVILSVCSQSE